MSHISARDLLAHYRESEQKYLESIRSHPHLWLERHLSASRIRVIDAAIRRCDSGDRLLNDPHSKKVVKNHIDRVAWTFEPPTCEDIRQIVARFWHAPSVLAAE